MREIEKSIIGSLLIDENSISKILHITPEMFTDSLYGAVFHKLKTAFEGGRTEDITTLSLSLGSDSLPTQYIIRELGECVKDTITSANIEEYASKLHDAYKRREAVKIVDKINGASDVNATLTECINNMTALIGSSNNDGHTLAELVKQYKGEYFREKEREYLYFGLESVDKAVGGLDKGDVTVIAARPAVGKSAFSLQIAMNLVRKGKKVAYFNLEMKESQIYERIIASESGVELQKIRHATSALKDDFTAFMNANDKVSTINLLTVYDGSRTVTDIRQKVMTGNFDVVIIDYVQLIIPAQSRGANRTAEVGDISRGIKAIATDFGTHVIGLSQLNRASEQRPNKEPTMSEIRESGSIEQDASNILIMWNPDEYDRTKKALKVEKARNGCLEKVELEFDGAHMRFTEPSFADAEEDCPFD